jgi:hypothetical protein
MNDDRPKDEIELIIEQEEREKRLQNLKEIAEQKQADALREQELQRQQEQEEGIKRAQKPGDPDYYLKQIHYRQTAPARGLGIASMVLGICSVTVVPCLTPIPALICGHKARKKAHQSGNPYGSGMALAGLITGYIGLIPMIIIGLAILDSVLREANRF